MHSNTASISALSIDSPMSLVQDGSDALAFDFMANTLGVRPLMPRSTKVFASGSDYRARGLDKCTLAWRLNNPASLSNRLELLGIPSSDFHWDSYIVESSRLASEHELSIFEETNIHSEPKASWPPVQGMPSWPFHELPPPAAAIYMTSTFIVLKKIRTCYILVVLGLATIVGSLGPALWRATEYGDISGGFSLAQYILSVGVFVVGCMVAIHSKSCSSWRKEDCVEHVLHGL